MKTQVRKININHLLRAFCLMSVVYFIVGSAFAAEKLNGNLNNSENLSHKTKCSDLLDSSSFIEEAIVGFDSQVNSVREQVFINKLTKILAAAKTGDEFTQQFVKIMSVRLALNTYALDVQNFLYSSLGRFYEVSKNYNLTEGHRRDIRVAIAQILITTELPETLYITRMLRLSWGKIANQDKIDNFLRNRLKLFVDDVPEIMNILATSKNEQEFTDLAGYVLDTYSTRFDRLDSQAHLFREIKKMALKNFDLNNVQREKLNYSAKFI